MDQANLGPAANWRAPASPQGPGWQPRTTRSMKPGHWVLGTGIMFILLGAFLPWASLTTPFGSLDVSGMKGDGQMTLVLGLVLAVLGGRHYVLPGKGTLIPPESWWRAS
jgi:hypothetical protein